MTAGEGLLCGCGKQGGRDGVPCLLPLRPSRRALWPAAVPARGLRAPLAAAGAAGGDRRRAGALRGAACCCGGCGGRGGRLGGRLGGRAAVARSAGAAAVGVRAADAPQRGHARGGAASPAASSAASGSFRQLPAALLLSFGGATGLHLWVLQARGSGWEARALKPTPVWPLPCRSAQEGAVPGRGLSPALPLTEPGMAVEADALRRRERRVVTK
jgi:hypothetical protein